MAKTAQLKARLTLDTSAYSRGLKAAEKGAKAFAATAGGVAVKGIKALELAMLAGGAALAYGVEKAYALGDQLDEMSDRTGIAVDQLLVLKQAAQNNGIEDIEVAVKKMQVALVDAVRDGASPASKALNTLGLDAEALIRKTPVAQLQAIGAAIAKIQSPALRAAEAVSIFGRSGTAMLSLFSRGNAELGDAANQVGRQAEILRENAQRFAKVSEALSRAGLKLQGFFVGVAEKILPLMEQATKRLDALDLASMGEKFGEGIRTGVDYLAGALTDPATFIDASTNLLKGGLLWAANLFAARMLENAANFGADLLGVISKAASYMDAALEYSFQSALEFFRGNWQESLGSLADGLIGVFFKAITFLTDGIKNAWKLISDPTAFQNAKNEIKLQVDNVATGKHRNFQDFVNQNETASPLNQAAQSLRDSVKGIVGKDFFGAQEFVDKGRDAAAKLRETGKKVVDAMIELPTKSDPAKAWQALNNKLTTGSLATGALKGTLGVDAFSERFHPATGTSSPFSSSLDRGAYDQSPLLKASERRSFENSRVALGISTADSRATTGSAYGVVKSGDFRRSRNVELQKERDYQKNQAANIANIANNTAAVADALGGKGQPAAGG